MPKSPAVRSCRLGLTLTLVLALAAGTATSVSLADGPSGVTDLRGDYTGGSCTSGTIAQCEASPQYPHKITVDAEDLTTGVIGGTGYYAGKRFSGQVTGCTVTIHAENGSGYSSDSSETISADGSLLEGTFNDTNGQKNQPTYDRRTSGGPSSCPVSSTPPPTTTTTTTTTPPPTTPTTPTPPPPTKRPTATQVMCDFELASASDTCTATVGDASGQAGAPTGAVAFTSAGGGIFSAGSTCRLRAQPGDVGVRTCAVRFLPPTAGGQALPTFPAISAAYAGDGTFAASTGTSSFLVASPANTAYLPTIERFSPPMAPVAVDNPVADSTVDVTTAATADLTSLGTCSVADAGETPAASRSALDLFGSKAVAKHPVATVRTLRARVVRRHVRKGRLHVTARLSRRALLKRFPTATRVQIVVSVTITPRHGHAATVFRRKTITLRAHRPSGRSATGTAAAVPDTFIWAGGGGCGNFSVSTPSATSATPEASYNWTDVRATCVVGPGGGSGSVTALPDLRHTAPGADHATSFTFSSFGGGGGLAWRLEGTLTPTTGTVTGGYTANGTRQDGTPFACRATPPALARVR